MKIGFVLGEFPVISETFIIDELLELVKRGFDIEILATRTKKPVQKYAQSLEQRTSYGDARSRNRRQNISDRLRLFVRWLRQCPSIAWSSLLLPGRGFDGLKLKALDYTEPFLEGGRRRYDVVHAQFGPNGLKALQWMKLGLIEGPLIVSFHGYDVLRFPTQNGKGVYNELFQKSELILVACEYFKPLLQEQGCPPDKLLFHGDGLDMSQFQPISRSATDEGIFQILSIGRLVEKKGFDVAIQALNLVQSRFTDFEYHIVGDGPKKSSLEELIRRFRLEDRVVMHGALERESVIRLLGTSNLLLAPSVRAKDDDLEGIPVVIKEAMCMGLPVIASRHSGIPELVRDGINGYLVPERNPDLLAEKIVFMRENSGKRLEMGARGRIDVQALYDIKPLCDQLEGIYNRVALPVRERRSEGSGHGL